MRMLSVGYLAEDCSSLVDSGAPTRTRTADLLITNQYITLYHHVSHGLILFIKLL